MDIEKTLTERGNRYGDFTEHARIAQELKYAMGKADGWLRLTPAMKQALEVIQDKVARILNGDPTYADNWHDIIGYARLVEKTLPSEAGVTAPEESDSYKAAVKHYVDRYKPIERSDWQTLYPQDKPAKSHTQD